MNILFFSNTYLPHVGGVAKSVHTLENAFREQGHEVRIVAPEFEGAEPDRNVLRVPAIQNFNGSDFSVRIPLPNAIWDFVEDFDADIVHSHHPFLLGDAALRIARRLEVPILFTHHTLYERYTHYVPFDSPAMKRMAIVLSVEYCNLCDRVIAPSRSVANLLEKRGVESPVEPIPTGIDCDAFAGADGAGFRKANRISSEAKVIGTVSRLAKEKNLLYLAEAVASYLQKHTSTVFLIVGEGEAKEEMLEILGKDVPEGCIRMVGKLSGAKLHDAYAAMDCFVFASQTETQGLVLAEALAAGKAVVALDGPGVREVVEDGRNGTLLPADAPPARFTESLEELFGDEGTLHKYTRTARESIAEYDTEVCAGKMLDCYQTTISKHASDGPTDPPDYWRRILAELETEWDLAVAKTAAIRAGFRKKDGMEVPQLD